MPPTFDDFRARVDAIIQDDAGFLTLAEKDAFITESAAIFSKDRPRERLASYWGSEPPIWEFPLPPDFEDGFSSIIRLEFPAGARIPRFLDPETYVLYRMPDDALVLRLLQHHVGADEELRITYTARHVLTATEVTIADADFDAVANLAASLCCRALAARFAQHSDSTIAADAVDYGAKVDQYTSLANSLYELYRTHVKPLEELARPASAFVDLDVTLATGQRRLYHEPR